MQIKYVIYDRVSDEDQRNNTSRRSQNGGVRDDVEEMFPGSTCVKSFSDVGSGWKGKQPELLAAYRYIKWYNQVADYPITHLLTLIGDRFVRDKDKAGEWRIKFREIGVEVNSTREWVDFTDPGQVIVHSVREALAQAESMKNSERTKRGMKQRMREGDWIFDVPMGYRKSMAPNSDGRKVIEIDPEPARQKVRAMSFIAGGLSIITAWRKCGGKDTLGSYNSFCENLTNPFDLGLIDYTWPDGEVTKVRGNHPPIVTKELQDAVKRQRKKNSRSDRTSRQTKRLARNPLRQVMCCPKCGERLTSSTPQSRGKRYEYYSCVQRGCSYNLRREKAHRHVRDLVLSIKPGKEAIARLEKKASDNIAKKSLEADLRAAIEQNDARQKRLEVALDLRFDGEIDAADLKRAKDLASQTQEKVNECRLALQGFEGMRRKFSAAFANIGETIAKGLQDDAKPELALQAHDFLGMLFVDGLCLIPETTRFGITKPNQFLCATGLLSITYTELETGFPALEARNPASGGRPGSNRRPLESQSSALTN